MIIFNTAKSRGGIEMSPEGEGKMFYDPHDSMFGRVCQSRPRISFFRVAWRSIVALTKEVRARIRSGVDCARDLPTDIAIFFVVLIFVLFILPFTKDDEEDDEEEEW